MSQQRAADSVEAVFREDRGRLLAVLAARFGREDVGSASGPASVVLRWCGRKVGNLGPGLTSESADAARAVLRKDLSDGSPFFWHPPAVHVLSAPPGLDAGSHRSDGQRVRAIPSTSEKRWQCPS